MELVTFPTGTNWSTDIRSYLKIESSKLSNDDVMIRHYLIMTYLPSSFRRSLHVYSCKQLNPFIYRTQYRAFQVKVNLSLFLT